MNKLQILQYNVQKGKNKVMTPLLTDTRVHSYDIIAIQKPWTNPFTPTTYCLSCSPFTVAYDNCKRRSCFLINKEINSEQWDVKFPSSDLCVLNLRLRALDMWIYNIYSQSSRNLSNTDYTSPIFLLPALVRRKREHIILGDFNLHHPWWSGPSNPTIHAAAESLVECLTLYEISLVSPAGVPTWAAQGSFSTIDLTFISQGLVGRVIECRVSKELDHRSDHLPISSL